MGEASTGGALAGDLLAGDSLAGDSLAALAPHVAAPLEELMAALNGVGLDPGLLELCASRIEQMVGSETVGGEAASAGRQSRGDVARGAVARGAGAQDDGSRVVLAFTEQYVLDAHGVTDELCAELNAHLSPPELAALTTAIATFEALARSRVALKGIV